MSPMITELSPETVIPAIEANLCACGRALGQSPLATLYDSPELLTCLTGIPHPIFNSVLRTSLKIEEADRRIEETLARFQARGVPMLWATGPSSQPADLGARLLAHGFVQEERPGIGAENVGMAVGLLAMNESPTAPAGLTIRRVEDEADAWRWAEASRQGFDVTQDVSDGWLRLNMTMPASDPWRHFLGLMEGEPVATCSLLPGGCVAGIYNVSTVPEARRQGIGTAMVLAALRAGRAMGYRVGVLMAAPMGVRVYRRIGFAEYCLFGAYYWLGPTGTDACEAANEKLG